MTMMRTLPNLSSINTPINCEPTSIKKFGLPRTWEAIMDRLDRLSITLDRLSITLDSYCDMMKRHNKYMLTTLQQLVHDTQELCALVPSEPSPEQLQHQQCPTKHETVLPKRETMPTLLPLSIRSGNIPLPSSHAQKLYHNHVMLNHVQPQAPCAIPHPPHQQAPYKLPVLAPPSTHLPSPLLPPQPAEPKQISIPLISMTSLSLK